MALQGIFYMHPVARNKLPPPDAYRKGRQLGGPSKSLAEEEGFEPPVPLGTPVFKTGAFNRSATPPAFFCGCKDKLLF